MRPQALAGAPNRIVAGALPETSIFDHLTVPDFVSVLDCGADTGSNSGSDIASGGARHLDAVNLEWDGLMNCAWHDGSFEAEDLASFAMGRTILDPASIPDAEHIEFAGRLLSFASFFFAVGEQNTNVLRTVLPAVGPRPELVALADELATSLGTFNATHLRRTDLLKGLYSYREVTAEQVVRNLRSVFERSELLVVCSDAPGQDSFFDPLRREFPDVIFANEMLLGAPKWRGKFDELPVPDENALGILSQELAAHGKTFVGTIGSTFTGMIHRRRLELELADTRFLYTADFTPPGPQYEDCCFQEQHAGPFSWNRIGYGIGGPTLSWFREWPEAARFL